MLIPRPSLCVSQPHVGVSGPAGHRPEAHGAQRLLGKHHSKDGDVVTWPPHSIGALAPGTTPSCYILVFSCHLVLLAVPCLSDSDILHVGQPEALCGLFPSPLRRTTAYGYTAHNPHKHTP